MKERPDLNDGKDWSEMDLYRFSIYRWDVRGQPYV